MSSVVSDSQISLTWSRKHLMAAIQLAASCGELCFSRSRPKVRLRVYFN